jgi:hypothetical protein
MIGGSSIALRGCGPRGRHRERGGWKRKRFLYCQHCGCHRLGPGFAGYQRQKENHQINANAEAESNQSETGFVHLN